MVRLSYQNYLVSIRETFWIHYLHCTVPFLGHCDAELHLSTAVVSCLTLFCITLGLKLCSQPFLTLLIPLTSQSRPHQTAGPFLGLVLLVFSFFIKKKINYFVIKTFLILANTAG